MKEYCQKLKISKLIHLHLIGFEKKMPICVINLTGMHKPSTKQLVQSTKVLVYSKCGTIDTLKCLNPEF